MSESITEVLSVEAVKAAYEATHLKPVRDDWGDYTTCACAASAVVLARRFIGDEHSRDAINRALNSRDELAALASLVGVGRGELAFFTDGFDGKDHNPPGHDHKYRAAYEHGKAVARAVFGGAA